MFKRGAIGVVIVIVVALVITLGVTIYTVRRPLPTTDATVRLKTFDHDVTVYRDERGVPTILAQTDADLMRAQGYVHAQDRFFEMDYRRHVTAGRLAEMVGDVPAAIEADKVIRTFGWRRIAEAEWKVISQESRDLLTAYSEGVNAYLAGREASELGVEYTILGLSVATPEVERWSPIDSLAWMKAMAWDLRNNFHDELLRANTYFSAGDVPTVEQLFPPYPTDAHPPIIPPKTPAAAPSPARGETAGDSAPSGDRGEVKNADERAIGPVDATAFTLALASAATNLDAIPELIGGGEGTGSNSFVIGGKYTDTGKPIVANDPHLKVSQPGVWHQIGLKCVNKTDQCSFDVSGFSFAGLPGIVIGHNDKLAWGLTNTGADVTDFYLERVFDDDTYLRDGEQVELNVRRETIQVAEGDPIELTVREGVHGPIITDVYPTGRLAQLPVPAGAPAAGNDGYAVSLCWTALQPGRSMDAVFAINRATNEAEVKAAAAMFEVPAQNIVWANTDGDFGYQMPGKIPVRGVVPDAVLPADGTWPRPGWDSAYDWLDYLPAASLPSVTNPEEGFIVAANQAITAPGVKPFVGSDFDYGYRSAQLRKRITADIAAGKKISAREAEDYMLDDTNPFAEQIVPHILALPVDDPFIKQAVATLHDWQKAGYPQSVDSPGAAYFASIWAHLLDLTFKDHLTDAIELTNDSRWLAVMERLLQEPESHWWDDRTTVNVRESRDEILMQALEAARNELTNTQAKDPRQWRWGKMHRFNAEHPLLGGQGVPALVRWLVNGKSLPVGGGSAIVNATGWKPRLDSEGRPDYQVTSGPSMRMVVPLADLDQATWVNLTGNSGHPASSHYLDQAGPWAAGEYFAWPFSPAAVKDAASSTLVIHPR